MTSTEGSADRESWVYRLTLPGPSVTTTVRASADRVIHIRQNSDPTCPWRGRSGLEVAQSSGGLASTLVHALTAEGEVPISRIIPQPQGDSQSTANSIRNAITTGLRLALPETVASGRMALDGHPLRSQIGNRIGLARTTWRAASTSTRWPCRRSRPCAAYRRRWHRARRPRGLLCVRAFRQFVALTVQPLGRILEAEVSRVLERDIRLRHDELASADVASRARAYKSLVENDVDKDRALQLVGWAS